MIEQMRKIIKCMKVIIGLKFVEHDFFNIETKVPVRGFFFFFWGKDKYFLTTSTWFQISYKGLEQGFYI